MNKEDIYMIMQPRPEQRKALVKLLQSVLLNEESPLVRQKLKMLTTVDAVGDCLLTVNVGESYDLVSLVMDELGNRYRMEDAQEVALFVTEVVRCALLKCEYLQSRLKRYERMEEAIKEIYEKDIPKEQ